VLLKELENKTVQREPDKKEPGKKDPDNKPLQPAKISARNEKKQIYPLSQLLIGQEYPPGVDPLKREEHLSDEEFVKVFGMSKEEWSKVADWKKEIEKKKAKLF